MQQANAAGHGRHEECLVLLTPDSTLAATNSPSFGIRSGKGTVDVPWLTALSTLMKRSPAMPARGGLVDVNAAR